MFKILKVIEKEECDKIYSQIHNLKNFITRGNNDGMATLGAASYLHADNYIGIEDDIDFSKPIGTDTDYVEKEIPLSESEGIYYPLHTIDYSDNKLIKNHGDDIQPSYDWSSLERYYDKLKTITNPILMKEFENLYDKICFLISKELNEKCLVSEDANLAYPGFNIFTPYKNCEKIDSPPHIDLQWNYHLDYLREIFDVVSEERFLTFTLSIRLPKSGAGLYIWDIEDEKISTYESAKYSYEKIITKCKSLFNKSKIIDKDIFEKETKPEFIEYQEGYMTIFNNLLLHQVAPFNLPYDNHEERITLQGHGIKCDNIWRLFF